MTVFYNTRYNQESGWTEVKIALSLKGVDFSDMTTSEMDSIDILDISLSQLHVTGNTFFINPDIIQSAEQLITALAKWFDVYAVVDENIVFNDEPFEVLYEYEENSTVEGFPDNFSFADQFNIESHGEKQFTSFTVVSKRYYDDNSEYDTYGPPYIQNFLMRHGLYEEDCNVFDDCEQNLTFNKVESILQAAKTIRFTKLKHYSEEQ